MPEMKLKKIKINPYYFCYFFNAEENDFLNNNEVYLELNPFLVDQYNKISNSDNDDDGCVKCCITVRPNETTCETYKAYHIILNLLRNYIKNKKEINKLNKKCETDNNAIKGTPHDSSKNKLNRFEMKKSIYIDELIDKIDDLFNKFFTNDFFNTKETEFIKDNLDIFEGKIKETLSKDFTNKHQKIFEIIKKSECNTINESEFDSLFNKFRNSDLITKKKINVFNSFKEATISYGKVKFINNMNNYLKRTKNTPMDYFNMIFTAYYVFYTNQIKRFIAYIPIRGLRFTETISNITQNKNRKHVFDLEMKSGAIFHINFFSELFNVKLNNNSANSIIVSPEAFSKDFNDRLDSLVIDSFIDKLSAD